MLYDQGKKFNLILVLMKKKIFLLFVYVICITTYKLLIVFVLLPTKLFISFFITALVISFQFIVIRYLENLSCKEVFCLTITLMVHLTNPNNISRYGGVRRVCASGTLLVVY